MKKKNIIIIRPVKPTGLDFIYLNIFIIYILF